MKRNITSELLAWKTLSSGKPLMVTGARQIGKTYSINEFCQSNYQDYLYLNLFDHPEIVAMFAEVISTEDKIKKLQLILGRKIDFEKAAIFFDEVQESEDIIQIMKYFAEHGIGKNIICAGSLLGVKIHRFKKSFPVGKVKMLQMHPLNFEEFLMANDRNDLIDAIRTSYESNTVLSKAIHEKCLDFYRLHVCIGGMPEAIGQLLSIDNDILEFDETILRDIRASYLLDMNKYITTPLESSRIEAIYNSIPSQLANNSNKFQYSTIRKGARAKSYESALDWLNSSSMVYKSEMVHPPLQPLKGYAKNGYFKLYFNDTGLLCNMLNTNLSGMMLDGDVAYKGVIVENYIASQLAAYGIPLYYWKNENTAEVDFLIETIDGVVPIEVKSSKHKASPSLRLFYSKYKPPYSIKITARNFGFENGIKSVPLYAVFCLPKLV